MIVKRKLYSVMGEEGNLGYYLYNEATGEEKLFSVVEEERGFARGVNMHDLGKGLKKINKENSKKFLINKAKLANPTRFGKSDNESIIRRVRKDAKKSLVGEFIEGSDINTKINRKQAKLDNIKSSNLSHIKNPNKSSLYKYKYHTADQLIPGALLNA